VYSKSSNEPANAASACYLHSGVARNVNWGAFLSLAPSLSSPSPFNGGQGYNPWKFFLKLKVLVSFRAFWASKLTPL